MTTTRPAERNRRLYRLAAAVTIAAALLWSASECRADRQIYMYRDAKGVIHFTNAPSDDRFRPFKIKGEVRVGTGSAKIVPAELHPFIDAAAQKYGLDPALINAVIRVESAFNCNAVSWAGAQGLMQLMPGTADLMGVVNAFNPKENIFGGSRYLRTMLNRFGGDLDLALAAYNCGPERVAKDQKIPNIRETQAYVKKVKYYYELYKKKT